MQDKNKPRGFRRFLRDNGYYLIVGICVLAIGVSGFFLLRGSHAAEEDASLNVPVTIKPDGGTAEGKKETGTADTQDAAVQLPPDDTVEAADSLAPSEAVPASRSVIAPLNGDTLAIYSVTALAYNETTRDWRTHDGLDLAAVIGTPVSATEAGTVSAVYSDDFLGTTVEIQHDSGYTTVYSNLEESPGVTVGQTVRAGETIGTVGQTALLEVARSPHLHFSVRKDGVSTDPAVYLS